MSVDTHAAVLRLRVALEGLAEALGRADLDGLLASEPALGDALDGVARLRPAGGDAAARLEIERASAVLLRCRRLGASLADFARISFDPGDACGYVRDGVRGAVDRATTMVARG